LDSDFASAPLPDPASAAPSVEAASASSDGASSSSGSGSGAPPGRMASYARSISRSTSASSPARPRACSRSSAITLRTSRSASSRPSTIFSSVEATSRTLRARALHRLLAHPPLLALGVSLPLGRGQLGLAGDLRAAGFGLADDRAGRGRRAVSARVPGFAAAPADTSSAMAARWASTASRT
jgi:hypothetical protein